MKVVLNGHAWHGIYIDSTGSEHEFVTFAENIDEAIKQSHSTLPTGVEIVSLDREVIPEDKRELDVDTAHLEEQLKRRIN